MSLSHIHPHQRSLLRLHGWLLMLWAASVGLLTSAALLHVFQLHSMAIRYALGAGAVYAIGFVLGGWWYARWWNGRRRAGVALPAHASAQEQEAYNQSVAVARKKWDVFNNVGDLLGMAGEDPLSALLFVLGLVGVVLLATLLLGYLPVLAGDLLAGYLAEILLEFVIGSLLVRRVLRPRGLDQYWGFVVRKTWGAGLLMVLVFGGLGAAIQHADPTAKTWLQALR